MNNILNKIVHATIIFALTFCLFCSCNRAIYKKTIYPYEQRRFERDTTLIKTPPNVLFDTIIVHQKETGVITPHRITFKIDKKTGDTIELQNEKIPNTSHETRVIIPNTDIVFPPKLRKKAMSVIESDKARELATFMITKAKERLNSPISNKALEENIEKQIEQLFNSITELDVLKNSFYKEGVNKDEIEKKIIEQTEKIRVGTSSYFIYWEIEGTKFAKEYEFNYAFESGKWELSTRMKTDLNKLTESFFKHIENFEKDYPKYQVKSINLRLVAYADETYPHPSLQKELEIKEDKTGIPTTEPQRRMWYNKKISKNRAETTRQNIYKYLENYNKKNNKQINLTENPDQGRGEERPSGLTPPYPLKDDRRRGFHIHLTFELENKIE